MCLQLHAQVYFSICYSLWILCNCTWRHWLCYRESSECLWAVYNGWQMHACIWLLWMDNWPVILCVHVYWDCCSGMCDLASVIYNDIWHIIYILYKSRFVELCLGTNLSLCSWRWRMSLHTCRRQGECACHWPWVHTCTGRLHKITSLSWCSRSQCILSSYRREEDNLSI